MIVNCATTYNLGAVKLGMYHGEEVLNVCSVTPLDLISTKVVRASAIFSWDLPAMRELCANALFYGCEVEVGGPAVTFNHKRLDLPGVRVHVGLHDCDEVQGTFPMTWTSRGCIRDCPWCIVPTIEGREMRPIAPIYAPMILDNNFLALPEYHIDAVLQEWSGKKVDWNQGLDARLYTPAFKEKVEKYDVRPTVWRFAYDFGGAKNAVRRAVEDLNHINHNRIRVYILFNHDESPPEARDRVEEIISWGASPYPMSYYPLDWEDRAYHVSPQWTYQEIVDFRRFFSRAHLWRSMTYEDYKPRKVA